MSKLKVLVTGGPVFAYLDSVKIITNKFKGGLIAQMAEELSNLECEVTYLTSKDGIIPNNKNIKIKYHDGFNSYRDICTEMSPENDIIILGAAVANLIPKNPIKGKFPSHNYKPGDTIPIEFTIAPRVINDIHKAAPNASLFGFKLLSNASHSELIDAAHEIAIDSRATAIIANDTNDLQRKFIVGRERSSVEISNLELPKRILELHNNKFYRTVIDSKLTLEEKNNLLEKIKDISKDVPFKKTKSGFMFGCVAIKDGDKFITTARGKIEIDDVVVVNYINHETRTVHISSHNGAKASLNAPLLDNIFKNNPEHNVIIHTHDLNSKLPAYKYWQPGSVNDSIRNIKGNFIIDGHGDFTLKNVS